MLERIETMVENFSSEKSSEDNLLTVDQTSKLVKLSISTIYSKVSRKEIPAFKIGKRLYFSKNEIIAWIKSGKIKTIADIRNEINRR
ncbi:DNA-binding protein [Flavobacterium macacae]|uniref:DNA-binding protein n=2 Tax=Flavobacterium macacae TaxID=2488993 RepID=A0A3P3VXA0_9FLAO|nr:DNA-binding protein [Flavobacterium macacae]